MKIPIVNEHDEIMAKKERLEVDYGHDIFRTASLWITNGKGEILLAQRKLNKKINPGKWGEAVGGTVEGDDSYSMTVIREAAEELGLVDFEMTIGPKQLIIKPCRCYIQWYLACIDKPISAFDIQKDEVEQVMWISNAKLRDELITNPDKYIDVMPEILNLLI